MPFCSAPSQPAPSPFRRALRGSALLLLALLPALLVLAGCEADRSAPAGSNAPADASESAAASFEKEGAVAFMRGGDTLSTIDVEIADTKAERERGLMERVALPSGSGMIFLMERNEPQGFWMKNTPMALDVFFVGADSQIVRVVKNTTPYSAKTFESGAPAKFVVEVPAGYADRRGIVAGDRIRFERAAPAADSNAALGARPRQQDGG